MNLYDQMLNITGLDKKETIKTAISEVKAELKGLTKERMCLVYNSHLYDNLCSKHIVADFINTKDLGYDYEHYYVIVPDKAANYLVDLTYPQFFQEEDTRLNNLYNEGYQQVTIEDYDYYLNKVTNNNIKTVSKKTK